MSQQNLHPNPQGATAGNTPNQNMHTHTSQAAEASAGAAANGTAQEASSAPQRVVPQPTKGIATFDVQVVDGNFTSILNLQTSGYCFAPESYNNLYVLTPEEFAHLNNNGYFYKLENHATEIGNYLSFALYQLVQQDNFYGYQATVIGTQGKFSSAQELYNSVTNQQAALESRLNSVRQVALKNAPVFSKNVDVVVHSSDVHYLTTNLQKILNEEQFTNTVYFANLDALEKSTDFIVVARNRYLHRQIEELQRKVESYKTLVADKEIQLSKVQTENKQLRGNLQTGKEQLDKLSQQKDQVERERQSWEFKYKELHHEFYNRLDKATAQEKQRLQAAVTKLRTEFQAQVNHAVQGIKGTLAKTYTFSRPTDAELQKFVASQQQSSEHEEVLETAANTPEVESADNVATK